MIVATIMQAAGGSRVRVSPSQLIIDAKAAIGMGASTNTAYGPQMNERLRAFATARGVAAQDLPAPSSAAAWQSSPVLPNSLVRLLVWAAYAHGMPLAAVNIESASGVPRWGMAATGARSPAQREPLTRAAPPAATQTPPAATERPPAPPPTEPVAPATANDAPPPEAAPAASDAAGTCTTAMPAAWHLRDTETSASEGRAYPAGERIDLLRPVPGVSRGASERFFRVRVLSDRREGFAFVPTSAIPPCAQTALGDAVGGAIGVGMQATMKLVGKIVGGVVATTLTLAVVAAVMRRRQRSRAALRLSAPAVPAAPAVTPQPKASRST